MPMAVIAAIRGSWYGGEKTFYSFDRKSQNSFHFCRRCRCRRRSYYGIVVSIIALLILLIKFLMGRQKYCYGKMSK
jgi:hypothetical protein